MAKKMKPGQKRCPSCGATVSGPRTKTCPKCGHEFSGKPQKGPAPKAAPATVAAAKPTKDAGKPQIGQAQAVRDYLKDHPAALTGEIASALNKQGIVITSRYVAAIKSRINKTATATKATKTEAAVVAPAAPAVAETPTKNGGTITLEQVKKVACTIKTIGGFQRVLEVLDVIKELGGVKKFRELAEAMTVPGTDDVPY